MDCSPSRQKSPNSIRSRPVLRDRFSPFFIVFQQLRTYLHDEPRATGCSYPNEMPRRRSRRNSAGDRVAEPNRGLAPQKGALLRHAFASPLGHAFLAPLLGPLRHPFRQSHRRFLQGSAGCPVRLARSHPPGHLIHPRCKRIAEIPVRWRRQPTDQRGGHLQDLFGCPALLEAGHRTHQVACRQTVHRDVPLVKQQSPQPGSARGEPFARENRCDGWQGDSTGGTPPISCGRPRTACGSHPLPVHVGLPFASTIRPRARLVRAWRPAYPLTTSRPPSSM